MSFQDSYRTLFLYTGVNSVLPFLFPVYSVVFPPMVALDIGMPGCQGSLDDG